MTAEHRPFVCNVQPSPNIPRHWRFTAHCSCGWEAEFPTSSHLFAMNEARVHVSMHVALRVLPLGVSR